MAFAGAFAFVALAEAFALVALVTFAFVVVLDFLAELEPFLDFVMWLLLAEVPKAEVHIKFLVQTPLLHTRADRLNQIFTSKSIVKTRKS